MAATWRYFGAISALLDHHFFKCSERGGIAVSLSLLEKLCRVCGRKPTGYLYNKYSAKGESLLSTSHSVNVLYSLVWITVAVVTAQIFQIRKIRMYLSRVKSVYTGESRYVILPITFRR